METTTAWIEGFKIESASALQANGIQLPGLVIQFQTANPTDLANTRATTAWMFATPDVLARLVDQMQKALAATRIDRGSSQVQ